MTMDAAPGLLRMLGTDDAVVCEGDQCEVPEPTEDHPDLKSSPSAGE